MIRFLLVLLLGSAMACGQTATSTPPSPAETRLATVAPAHQIPGTSPSATPPGSSRPSATPASTPVASPRLVTATATAPVETSPPIEGPMVRVGTALFPVELALTVEQHSQGLSGREVLPPGTGMLFVYQRESRSNFWMKEMRFPLDIVWIGADCTVVDVTLDAPPPEPDQTLDQLPRYSPVDPAQYVLEINAGQFAAEGLRLGDPVEFAGDLAGRYGC